MQKPDDWEEAPATYYGVSLGMSKSDVIKAIGKPQEVDDGVMDLGIFKDKKNTKVEKHKFLLDEIPTGKTIFDYDSWSYSNSDQGLSSYYLKFEPTSQRLNSIYCNNRTSTYCKLIYGIGLGSDKRSIIKKLGNPSSIDDYVISKDLKFKNLNYSSLNLRLEIEDNFVEGILVFNSPINK